MTTYATGNPLGSKDPRDLYDNAENFDAAMNDLVNTTWNDRFGVSRPTMKGYEEQFNGWLDAQGFEPGVLEYVDGSPLTVDRPTQLIQRDGNLYSVKRPASFPVNLTGNWATDQSLLVIQVDQGFPQEIGRGVRRVDSVADLRAIAGRFAGDAALVVGYYAETPGVGGGEFHWDSTSTEDDNGGSIIQATGITTGRWKRDITHGVWAEWFGARNDGSDAAGTTAAVWAAIIALRHDPETIVQYIGGPTVTAYASGRLNFGNGVFALQPDSFDITQDLGLTIVGQGFRGKNQAMKAATTLVVRGTSSGFFFRHYGNGGRNLTFNNIDVVYDDSQFTGDIIETTSSPGLTLQRVRVGCYGGFLASRLTTARSCIRATFDEFIRCEDVVFDGAQYGFYSDGTINVPGLSFGGWGVTFLNCTFYDFAKSMVLHAGNRTRHSLNIIASYFNPINTSPERCHDIDNVEGLIIDGCQHTPSTGSQPSQEWFRVIGSTGRISCNAFAGLSSKLGTIGGANPSAVEWSNNRVSCQGGLTITGGVVRGGGNEYSNADHSVDVAPVAIVSLDIGPDIHKAGVTGYSYRISADSSMLSGRVNYSFEQDNSNSKYYSASTRVGMSNCDSRFITLATAGTTLSPYNAGRTYNVTVAGTQTLPTPIPGAAPIRILKSGANALTIATTSGTNFLIGASGSRTSAVATSTEVGSLIEFEPLTSTTWVGRVLSGTWSFT
ncbi:hypothetical protein ACIRUG_16270 [Pseudomonas aeruginosa]|uniref:hypothetical protein n=5 Tax=Pseudomonas aeruginosa TaxID=287 RepID=UPI001C71258A|nr:hypothetical protein [Pseudomonas aeruginosa]